MFRRRTLAIPETSAPRQLHEIVRILHNETVGEQDIADITTDQSVALLHAHGEDFANDVVCHYLFRPLVRSNDGTIN